MDLLAFFKRLPYSAPGIEGNRPMSIPASLKEVYTEEIKNFRSANDWMIKALT
jgi:hypothetical protein